MHPVVSTPGICVLKDVPLTGHYSGPDETITTNISTDTTHMDVAILPFTNQGDSKETSFIDNSTRQNSDQKILSCTPQTLEEYNSDQEPGLWRVGVGLIEETAISLNAQQGMGSQVADYVMQGDVSNTPQLETRWQNLGVGIQPVTPSNASIRKKRASEKLKNRHSVKIKTERMGDVIRLCTPQHAASGENPPLIGPEGIPAENLLIPERKPIPKKRDGRSNPEASRKRLETLRRNRAEAEKQKGILATWSSPVAHEVPQMSLRKNIGGAWRKIVEGQELPSGSTRIRLQEISPTEGTETRPRGISAPAGEGSHITISQPKQSEQPAREVRASSEIPQRFKERSAYLRSKSVPPLISNTLENSNHFSGVEICAQGGTHQSCNPRKRGACTVDAVTEPLLHHTRTRNPKTTPPTIEEPANENKHRSTYTHFRRHKRSSGRAASKLSKIECPGGIFRRRDSRFSRDLHPDLSGVDTSLSEALDISDGECENGMPSTLCEKLQRAEKRPRLQLYTRRRDSRGSTNQTNQIIPPDDRYHPGSLSFENNKWHIPYPCTRYALLPCCSLVV